MPILHLTWREFDRAVDALAKSIPRYFDGLFPVPRGGMPLAVALSHRCGLPVLHEQTPGALVVDDICDTGSTLRSMKAEHAYTWVARSGVIPSCTLTYHYVAPRGVWVVFPWENAANAHLEMKERVKPRRQADYERLNARGGS